MPQWWENDPVVGSAPDNANWWKNDPVAGNSQSTTPETDKAVAATAAPRKPVESVSDDFRDPVAAAATAISKPLSSAVDVAKGFVTGIPDFLKAASDPWGPDSLHQMIGGGLQNAIAIEKIKNNHPFSQEWWNGVVPITAQIGMMAAGAKGIISPEGGVVNASKIGSATEVPVRGVRPEMGQEAPLRQQGETAQAQETPVLSPTQGVLDKPPIQTEGGGRIEEEKANAVGQTPPQETQVASPLASTAAPASPTSTVPESANAGEVQPVQTGISNEAFARMAEEGHIREVPEGEGRSTQDLIDLGRSQIANGADPQLIARRIQRTKAVSPTEFSVLRAHSEDLHGQAVTAERQMMENPTPENTMKYDQAFTAFSDWARNVVQPAKTRTSDIFRAMQQEQPIDASSYTGLRKSMIDLNGEIKPEQEPVLRTKARAVQDASARSAKAINDLDAVIKSNAPKGGKRIASMDDLRARVAEKLKSVAPCN